MSLKALPSVTIARLLGGLFSFITRPIRAQDSEILLELLQKKGIVSDRDAAEVRSEMAKKREERQDPVSSASKLKLSDSITEAKIYGEVRLRYFVNEAEAAGIDAGDHGQRERLRYRFRLGSDIKLTDGWGLGFMLETNNSARSANVTLGENPVFAKATTLRDTSFVRGISTTNGKVLTGINPATGKPVTGVALSSLSVNKGAVVTNTNYGDSIFLGRVYLKYQPTEWLSLNGGKIANPFVSSRMVWDPDINPEGFSEQFRWKLGEHAVPAAVVERDGKQTTAPFRADLSLELFANFGQFIYEDVGFENSFNSSNSPFSSTPNATDRWMLGWQVGAKVNLTPTTYLQVAPAFYNYTGGGHASAGPFNGDSPLVYLDKYANAKLITFNQTGVNNLSFVEIPAEFAFTVSKIPAAIFGDFAYNFDGDERARNAGHPNKSGNIAYQAGARIGNAAKAGDWELRGWWQHSEAYSVDQNLVDDDIFDGRLNFQGFYLQGSYQLTNAVSFIVQYSHGSRIDNDLGTPGFGALGTAPGFPLQNVNLLYVDLNMKF